MGKQKALPGNHKGLVWLGSGRMPGAMRATAGKVEQGPRIPAMELALETMGGVKVCDRWCDLIKADMDLVPAIK